MHAPRSHAEFCKSLTWSGDWDIDWIGQAGYCPLGPNGHARIALGYASPTGVTTLGMLQNGIRVTIITRSGATVDDNFLRFDDHLIQGDDDTDPDQPTALSAPLVFAVDCSQGWRWWREMPTTTRPFTRAVEALIRFYVTAPADEPGADAGLGPGA